MSKIKDFYITNPDYKDQRADNKIDPYAVKESNGTPFTDEQWKRWYSNHKSSDEGENE